MKNKFLKKCLEIAVIVIGNAILAFGICAFITPHGIIVGGASGLGLIVKQITGIPLSLVVYVINIIMFIAGYFFLGKSFAAIIMRMGFVLREVTPSKAKESIFFNGYLLSPARRSPRSYSTVSER